MNYTVFTQFGLAGVMLAILFMLLQWMMKLHDKVMSDSVAEREKWQAVIGALTERIEAGTRSSTLFHEQVLEMGRRGREEHESIMKGILELRNQRV